jgi:protein transport protein SEC20
MSSSNAGLLPFSKSAASSDDALTKASGDVTDALRRTIDLMQGELERSVLTSQMLGV